MSATEKSYNIELGLTNIQILEDLSFNDARDLVSHLDYLRTLTYSYLDLLPERESIATQISRAHKFANLPELSKKIAQGTAEKIKRALIAKFRAISDQDYRHLADRLTQNHLTLQVLGHVDLYLSAYVSFLKEGHTYHALSAIDSNVEDLKCLCEKTSALIRSKKKLK